jgi:hypothetical protein
VAKLGINWHFLCLRLSVALGAFTRTVLSYGIEGSAFFILGSELTGATNVTSDGTAATFTVVSATEIKNHCSRRAAQRNDRSYDAIGLAEEQRAFSLYFSAHQLYAHQRRGSNRDHHRYQTDRNYCRHLRWLRAPPST